MAARWSPSSMSRAASSWRGNGVLRVERSPAPARLPPRPPSPGRRGVQAEVEVGVRVLRVELDRLAVLGHRHVAARGRRGSRPGCSGRWRLRLELERGQVLGERLAERFFSEYTVARLSWAWADAGSSSIAFWNSLIASSSQPRSASSMPRALCSLEKRDVAAAHGRRRKRTRQAPGERATRRESAPDAGPSPPRSNGGGGRPSPRRSDGCCENGGPLHAARRRSSSRTSCMRTACLRGRAVAEPKASINTNYPHLLVRAAASGSSAEPGEESDAEVEFESRARCATSRPSRTSCWCAAVPRPRASTYVLGSPQAGDVLRLRARGGAGASAGLYRAHCPPRRRTTSASPACTLAGGFEAERRKPERPRACCWPGPPTSSPTATAIPRSPVVLLMIRDAKLAGPGAGGRARGLVHGRTPSSTTCLDRRRAVGGARLGDGPAPTRSPTTSPVVLNAWRYGAGNEVVCARSSRGTASARRASTLLHCWRRLPRTPRCCALLHGVAQGAGCGSRSAHHARW